MNRLHKVVLLVVVLLLMAVPLASAQEDQTIAEIAANDGRFTTLVAAVEAAGLGEALSGGEWTVFAPTDDAFAKLGLNADNIANQFTEEELTSILLYHVLTEKVHSDVAKTMLGDITMANGALAGLKFYEDDLYVNDDSKVIIPNILASNGIIHAVDTVILPPWPRPTQEEVQMEVLEEVAEEGVVEEMPAVVEEAAEEVMEEVEAPFVLNPNSIAGIAASDGRFTTLVAAVEAAGLTQALSGGGPWTVFAPTDDAFAKLGLNADNIAREFTQEELTSILLYHALTEEVHSDIAKTMLGDITMANGALAGLKFFDDTLWVNDDARVIQANIFADNGIIHAVDNVILPPWPRQPEPEMEMAAEAS